MRSAISLLVLFISLSSIAIAEDQLDEQSLELSEHSSQHTGESVLVSAFNRARENDFQYRAAKAEYETNIIDSRIAGSAYYPQLTITSSQIADEKGDQRHTASLIQPILSSDKYATMKEAEPREAIAKATFRNRQYELAARIYKVFSDITIAREGIEQNRARIDALKHQYEAGKRTYELGQGTLTDMADARVKMLQAEADNLKLKNELQAAVDEYYSMVGELPPEFSLNRQSSSEAETIEGEKDQLGQWVDQNNDVILARLNQRLAELEISRARSAWLPELNASYTYTSLSGQSDTFVGLSLTMPIRASKVYGLSSAKHHFTRMKEDALDKKRQATLEIQRLSSAVESGITELATRREAIEAAKLSVTANEKSYKGGVRSILDVLASIDALYSIEGEYVEAALALGENFLNLRIQQGQHVIKSLRDVEHIILSTNH